MSSLLTGLGTSEPDLASESTWRLQSLEGGRRGENRRRRRGYCTTAVAPEVGAAQRPEGSDPGAIDGGASAPLQPGVAAGTPGLVRLRLVPNHLGPGEHGAGGHALHAQAGRLGGAEADLQRLGIVVM